MFLICAFELCSSFSNVVLVRFGKSSLESEAVELL